MSGEKIDFESLGKSLLLQSESLLCSWFPSGKKTGREFVVGDLKGNPGSSLSVNTLTGKWADFSSNEVGGDLISLYAAIHSKSQIEAARELSRLIGFGVSAKAPDGPKRPQHNLGPAPLGTSGPAIPSNASDHWIYRNANEEEIFYVVRFELPDGKKEFRPYSFDLNTGKWVTKAPAAPRPLYGLELLAKKPGAPVLIVEGERAADAARILAGRAYTAVTWPNGSNSVSKVDWTPLYGRKILIWPDADEPGKKAAALIAGLLVRECPEVKVLNVPLDGSLKDGYDAADALQEGWDWGKFVAFAKQIVKAVNVPVEPEVLPEVPPVEPADKKDTDHVTESRKMFYERLGVACSENGSPICNVDNCLRVIEGWFSREDFVWFDEFHNKYFTKWKTKKVREWTDNDDLSLLIWMQREAGLRRVTESMVNRAVIDYANQRVRNEPRDWLKSLEWDGIPRVEECFVKYFGAEDSNYSRAISKNWWIAMVARIFSPGCKVDNMVVLEGEQGKLKSTALNVIGGDWYAESHEQITSKDFFGSIQGRLIVEISEMDSFKKAQVSYIKKIITCKVDRFRPPYGRVSRDFPRTCVFVGTTNEDEYLKDATGARRFWPLRVGDVDVEALKRDRHQLFAEAASRFKSGETWYEVPKNETEEEQRNRGETDPWDDFIRGFLLDRAAPTTIMEIATDCLGIEKWRVDLDNHTHRIGSCLRRLDWEKTTKRIGADKKPHKCWVPKNSSGT